MILQSIVIHTRETKRQMVWQQKKTSTIATNVASIASINWHGKKGKLYFAYIFISDHITIDNFY